MLLFTWELTFVIVIYFLIAHFILSYLHAAWDLTYVMGIMPLSGSASSVLFVSYWANLNLGLSCGRRVMLENIRTEYRQNPLEPAVPLARVWGSAVVHSDLLGHYVPVTASELKKSSTVSRSHKDGISCTSKAGDAKSSAAQWQGLCWSIYFSNVVFPLCDGLYCTVSCFLFASSYASWQDLFQSILHFKWILIMFNHSILSSLWCRFAR